MIALSSSSRLLAAIIISIIACNIISSATAYTTFDTTIYDNYLALSSTYTLYWLVNRTSSSIRFGIQAQTTGWVGLGISPNGGMVGADVVISWVDSAGKTYVTDRMATAQAQPPIDSSQDWHLISSYESDGYTSLELSRQWATCDTYDLVIPEGTAHVIWSWATTDPVSPTSLVQHAARGTQSINLRGERQFVPSTDPTSKVAFALMNATTIPAVTTTYMCRAVRLPTTAVKTHITSFQAVINDASLPYVHHVLIYDCPAIVTADLSYQGDCFSSSMPNTMKACSGASVIAGWAVGGTPFYFPEVAGFPMGGSDGVHSVLIQMHYNNPNHVAGVVDSSGISFNYTTNLRQYDAGMLQTGYNLGGIIIPPLQATWESNGHCPSGCTSRFIPSVGVTVVAAMLHSHLLGTSLRATVIRGGVEYPLVVNPQYDFNYQSYDYVTPSFTLLPGDHIRTQCIFNSLSRPLATVGGIATTDEMCLSYIVYYPRMNLTDCESQLPVIATLTRFATTAIAAGMNQTAMIYYLSQAANGIIPYGEAFQSAGIVWNATQLGWWKAAVAANPLQQQCNREAATSMTIPTIVTPYVAWNGSCSIDDGSDEGTSTGTSTGVNSSASVSASSLLLIMIITMMAHMMSNH